MEITISGSIIATNGQHYDLKVEAHTSVENTPPLIKLHVNGSLAFVAPMEILNEISRMLETARYAIKQHSIGPVS